MQLLTFFGIFDVSPIFEKPILSSKSHEANGMQWFHEYLKFYHRFSTIVIIFEISISKHGIISHWVNGQLIVAHGCIFVIKPFKK